MTGISELADATEVLEDPIISEFETQSQAESYDRWFRDKVQRSIDSTRPTIPHEEAMANVRRTLDAAIQRFETRLH
jgi:hypothetical protein